jgi:hypothetical protein
MYHHHEETAMEKYEIWLDDMEDENITYISKLPSDEKEQYYKASKTFLLKPKPKTVS